MPITHTHKLYSTADAQVSKLLTDPAGGSATYGALTDVPGIKTVGLGFELNTVSLTGDNKELETDTTLRAVTVAFSHAKVSYDALAVFLGGTVTDSGTTPAQIARFRRLGADVLPYFKFEAKTPTSGVDTIGGDAHIVVYKGKVTDYSIPFAEQDYAIMTGTFRGVARISDDLFWDILTNETSLAIA